MSSFLTVSEIHIRDPFIVADKSAGLYRMYAQSGNRADSGFTGVEVTSSRDLVHWSSFRAVLALPPEWMALDGTLWTENGSPWLVFCHEWVQTVNGRMMAVPLTPDLGAAAGEPELLFPASAAPGSVVRPGKGLVTDGPFLYRTEAATLLMLWSTFLPGHGYALLVARSDTGGVLGPWSEHRSLLYTDGGHGMLFRGFGGELLLALHQPNSRGDERLKLCAVQEENGWLRLDGATGGEQ